MYDRPSPPEQGISGDGWSQVWDSAKFRKSALSRDLRERSVADLQSFFRGNFSSDLPKAALLLFGTSMPDNDVTTSDLILPPLTVGEGDTLPFSAHKQLALLGHLLTDEKFFVQGVGKILPEWFVTVYVDEIWKVVLSAFARYQRFMSVRELQESYMWLQKPQGERNKLAATLIQATAATKDYGIDIVRDELTIWYKTRVFKKYQEKSMALYLSASDAAEREPARRLAEAFAYFRQGAHQVDSASFELEHEVDFSDITGPFWEKRQEQLRDALTFGNPAADRLLNPTCVSGSLLLGDHTILLAPTNVGKTTTLISVACANIMLGKSVLFVTHEGTPDDIKTKLLQCFLRKTYLELLELYKTPAGEKKLRQVVEAMQKCLVYVPMNRPGLTVEDVELTIRRHVEKRAAEGRPFHLIIDDYPAILTTVEASRGHMSKRHIDERVYRYFTQAALDFNVHMMTAIQTNREGSKINAGNGHQDRLLVSEDVSESFGPIMTAANVISLNRDKLAAAQKRLVFHFCKSRSSETGWSVVGRTDFSRACTHSPYLPVTWYRGTGTPSENVDSLLDQHAGNPLPEQFHRL